MLGKFHLYRCCVSLNETWNQKSHCWCHLAVFWGMAGLCHSSRRIDGDVMGAGHIWLDMYLSGVTRVRSSQIERERERLILITGHKFIDYILSGGITRILLRRLFLTIWLGCQETDWIDLVLAFLLSFVFRFGSNGNGIPFFDQQKLQLRWAPTRNGVISPL